MPQKNTTIQKKHLRASGTTVNKAPEISRIPAKATSVAANFNNYGQARTAQ
jgi:hypothetical protein